ncbi:unnamed protein product [Amoebophrya sp. A25]|nr:unnamed protein product [Amoebophrya sp. A25]|eukprot:GSA25T00018708001.1
MGQISALQRKQMTTVQSKAAKVIAFEGGGDDLDGVIKNLSRTLPNLVGVNSFNIGRPVAQTVYYFWIYLQMLAASTTSAALAEEPLGVQKQEKQRGDVDQEALPLVDFAVPTGAMGNLTAGFFARRLGVPIRNLVTACNVNDVTYRTLSSGIFERAPEMHKNVAEAMNIQVPYNFERLLYFALFDNAAAAGKKAQVLDHGVDADDATNKTTRDNSSSFSSPQGNARAHEQAGEGCKQRMEELSRTGKYALGDEVFGYFQKFLGCTYRVDDADILDTIRRHSCGASEDDNETKNQHEDATDRAKPDDPHQTSMSEGLLLGQEMPTEKGIPYLLCPHSACGVFAAERHREAQLKKGSDKQGCTDIGPLHASIIEQQVLDLEKEQVPTVALATAHWCKFEDVVDEALKDDQHNDEQQNMTSPSHLRRARAFQLPSAALKILEKPERPYDLELHRVAGENEPNAHLRWESEVRELITRSSQQGAT